MDQMVVSKRQIWIKGCDACFADTSTFTVKIIDGSTSLAAVLPPTRFDTPVGAQGGGFATSCPEPTVWQAKKPSVDKAKFKKAARTRFGPAPDDDLSGSDGDSDVRFAYTATASSTGDSE